MTDFLVRRFVRDSENTESTEVRTRYGILASVVGIFCNVFLFAAKLIIGTLMHSLAVTADAFNNLSDAASSIISFIGVKMAGKPADAEHPFGHGRIEYIAALIVSFLVIEVGFTFFKTSVGKLIHPEEITFDLVPFLILILSILVKLWMAAFNKKLGKKIDSKVMLAAAADSIGDVITTSATVISILICYAASVNIDAIAGLIVSLLVIWSGFSIAKDTLEPLIGQRVPTELYQKISQAVESYDGIVGTHDLIVHNYGPNQGMATVEIFKPRIDVRYSEEEVVSHDANAIRSTPVESPQNILLMTADVDVVGIDEAQFFDESIVDVCRRLANNGVRVIVAGLDMDYTGKPFGPMPALMATAEYVTKVHAICVRCGNLAHHSHRLTSDEKQVMLGAQDSYEPICRHCFNKLMNGEKA